MTAIGLRREGFSSGDQCLHLRGFKHHLPNPSPERKRSLPAYTKYRSEQLAEFEDEEERRGSGFEMRFLLARRGITKDMLNLSEAMFSSKSLLAPLDNRFDNAKGKANRGRNASVCKVLGKCDKTSTIQKKFGCQAEL